MWRAGRSDARWYRSLADSSPTTPSGSTMSLPSGGPATGPGPRSASRAAWLLTACAAGSDSIMVTDAPALPAAVRCHAGDLATGDDGADPDAHRPPPVAREDRKRPSAVGRSHSDTCVGSMVPSTTASRSEERRVGKECRS